jgi:hypothetical protein
MSNQRRYKNADWGLYAGGVNPSFEQIKLEVLMDIRDALLELVRQREETKRTCTL